MTAPRHPDPPVAASAITAIGNARILQAEHGCPFTPAQWTRARDAAIDLAFIQAGRRRRSTTAWGWSHPL